MVIVAVESELKNGAEGVQVKCNSCGKDIVMEIKVMMVLSMMVDLQHEFSCSDCADRVR